MMVSRLAEPRVKHMSTAGRKWLVELEGGVKLSAYLDAAGVPTIGAGMTYYPSGGRVKLGDRLESARAGLEMFGIALRPYERAVDASTTDSITQHVFDAFVSACYNIGQKAFAGATFVRLYNAGKPLEEVCRALERWNRAGGAYSNGLAERRACEVDLILTGVYRLQR